MKGDFSRRTFDPRKHYSGVQMQQGRVQLDAEWNEQSDILGHRRETEAQDVIGDHGAPLHEAGFHVVADCAHLTEEEQALEGNQSPPDLHEDGRDFFISAGRYYVDGILCESERIVTYRDQPDLPDPPDLPESGQCLVYLDVWQRHITALDDSAIREVALGGPDTATRVQTIWQVKCWLDTDSKADCLNTFDRFLTQSLVPIPPLAERPGMSARVRPAGTDADPCIIPPSAGYRGLENQLYRVEVHHPGEACDMTPPNAPPTFDVTAFSTVPSCQVTVNGGTWTIGDVVEVFRAAGDDPMRGIVAQVAAASLQ